jgi:hypothetical protein
MRAKLASELASLRGHVTLANRGLSCFGDSSQFDHLASDELDLETMLGVNSVMNRDSNCARGIHADVVDVLH